MSVVCTAQELLSDSNFLDLIYNKLVIRYEIRRDHPTYEICVVQIAGGYHWPSHCAETFFTFRGTFSVGDAFSPLEASFKRSSGLEVAPAALDKMLAQWVRQAEMFPDQRILLQPIEFVGKLDLGRGFVQHMNEGADDLHFHHGIVAQYIAQMCRAVEANNLNSPRHKESAAMLNRRFGKFMARLRHARAARVYGTPLVTPAEEPAAA
jgi:hypothetical protein